MSLITLVAVALASGSTPVKLAAPGLNSANLTPELTIYYSDHLAHCFALEGVRVVTQREISAMLGLERQKQLMGCADSEGACMAELANALGAEAILSGSIGHIGKAFQLDVKVFAASDGRQLSVYSARLGSEEALLDELARAAKKMAPELALRLGHEGPTAVAPPEVTAPAPSPSHPLWHWLPGAGGLVAAGVGAVCLGQAADRAHQLSLRGVDALPQEKAQIAHSEGLAFETGGFVAVGVGVAGVATTIGLLLFGAPESPVAPAVSLAPGPGDLGVAITGTFP